MAIAVLAVLVVVAGVTLMLVTPSASKAMAIARSQDHQHKVAFPGPAVPRRFADALIATEDHRFRYEPGVDPIAIGRVLLGRLTGHGRGREAPRLRPPAVRAGGDFVTNGTKPFISQADVADFIILFAASGTEQGRRGPRKLITCLLVDKDTPGLTVRRGPACVSNRGYHQCELAFSDCRVPVTSRLGEEGHGFDLLGQWLGATRLTVASTSIGRAQRVLDATVEWAATRKQFGQPSGQFQGVGFQLADLATELEAAELLTLRAAARLDAGQMTDADAAMAKVLASEMLGRMTDAAVQIFGGMGLMSELPVERWWRDARVERIWDGTSEIQRHIISRSLLRPYGA